MEEKVDLDFVRKMVKENDEWRDKCLNLIASENRFFPEIDDYLYMNDFMHRYAEGKPFARYYNGTKYVDCIEDLAIKHFSEHFGVPFVDVRPISGAIANLAVFTALPRKSGNVITNSLPSGGHITHNSMGTITKVCGKKVFNFPTLEDNPFKTDVDGTLRLIGRVEPDFIVFGKSMFLHPEPVREIREAYPDLTIVYDGAHVFGLIYTGAFQDPFKEGADILTASTHKTFPGPQGGIILAKALPFNKDIDTLVFPGILSNHHLHRLPVLLATALLLDNEHKDYGRKVVETAQRLARMLAEEGFKVVGYDGKEYTYTHQVVLDVSELGGGKKVADHLEQRDIIVNKNALPWDKSVIRPSGIRIGVQEAVLRGMNADEIGQRLIAALREITPQ